MCLWSNLKEYVRINYILRKKSFLCGVNAMEIWDGYFRDGTLAGMDLRRGQKLPEGIYHLVCEVLVRHTDGDYLLMKRSFSKPNHGGMYEATAGGAALKGENHFTCIQRELYEETGIRSDQFQELDHFVSDANQRIYYTFLCITDCPKDSVILQKGETISYKWVSEQEFRSFISSGHMIESHKLRYLSYFLSKGYITESA